MKKVVLSMLAFGLFLSNPAFADWEDFKTPGDLSAAGAVSVGTGVLCTLAAPVVLAGGLVSDPMTASSNAVGVAGVGLSATGYGIVFLLEGTGKGLSDLTENTLSATGTLANLTVETVAASVPRVTVEFPDQGGKSVKKSIPLVVRKEYVELHEKVDVKP